MSYTYSGCSEPALHDVTLQINRGQVVAFVGHTGSGKSTLVNIILGLLDLQLGHIQIDDVSLTENNIVAWRRKMGYVPQRIHLIDDTIARNIAFGINESDIDAQRLERAAKVANIHQFIVDELAEQYHTRVGEAGSKLSGGQRQRIGIARALYHDPEVILFDEATSALDGITENSVMGAVHQLSGHKTVLIIAHRLTTVQHADYIYLLDKGRIVDTGTYDQLLAKNKTFQQMTNAAVIA